MHKKWVSMKGIFFRPHDDIRLMDLLPIVANASRGEKLMMIGSPWSAPGWMKNNGLFYSFSLSLFLFLSLSLSSSFFFSSSLSKELSSQKILLTSLKIGNMSCFPYGGSVTNFCSLNDAYRPSWALYFSKYLTSMKKEVCCQILLESESEYRS